MTQKTSSRNPLLIPLIAVLVIAAVAIGLLFWQNSGLNAQITDLNTQLDTTSGQLQTTEETLRTTQSELETAHSDIDALTADKAELDAIMRAEHCRVRDRLDLVLGI